MSFEMKNKSNKLNFSFLKIISVLLITIIISYSIPVSAVIIKSVSIKLNICEDKSANTVTVTAVLSTETPFELGGIMFDIQYNNRAFKYIKYNKDENFLDSTVASIDELNQNYSTIRFAYESNSSSGKALKENNKLFSVVYDIKNEADSGIYNFVPLLGECGEIYEAGILMTSVNCDFTPCSYEISQEIILSDTRLNMIEHTRYLISANKKISSWYSSNIEVADVTNDGVVIARNPGRCFVVANTADETAFCSIIVSERNPVSVEVVQVQNKQYYCKNQNFDSTGMELNVTFDNNEEEIFSDGFSYEYDFSEAGSKEVCITYKNVLTSVFATVFNIDTINSDVYSTDNGKIYGIEANTDINTFRSNMNNNNIYLINDNQIVLDGEVATGMVATIYAEGHILDEKFLVVNGDINSDSKCDIKDLIYLKKFLVGNESLSIAQKYAANNGKSTDISALSLIKLKQILLNF